MTKPEYRLFWLWCALIALTLVSLESIHFKGWLSDIRYQSAAVIILAFIKVRLIILDFMEVRHAPIALRAMLEVWVVVICCVLIGLLFHTP